LNLSSLIGLIGNLIPLAGVFLLAMRPVPAPDAVLAGNRDRGRLRTGPDRNGAKSAAWHHQDQRCRPPGHPPQP